MMKHHVKSTLGRKVYFFFDLYFYITVHHLRKSRQKLKEARNLKAGGEAEDMEGAAYWLAPHGFLSLLPYKGQDHQPRIRPTTMGWVLSY